MTENEKQDNIEIIKKELDHYMRLCLAQAVQLKHYANLQKRSHTLIKNLLQRLNSKGICSD